MTVAPSTLVALQDRLVKNLHTQNLGIVGDQAHIETGGYHIGALSLRRAGMGNDYSLQYPADTSVSHDYACAIDIGGSPQLLMTLGDRIVHALMTKNPRVYKRVRGVNASWSGVTIDRRYDCENPENPADDNIQASDDRGHLHLEIYRSQVLSQAVMDDLYFILSGAVAPTPPSPAPQPPAPPPHLEEIEMILVLCTTAPAAGAANPHGIAKGAVYTFDGTTLAGVVGPPSGPTGPEPQYSALVAKLGNPIPASFEQCEIWANLTK